MYIWRIPRSSSICLENIHRALSFVDFDDHRLQRQHINILIIKICEMCAMCIKHINCECVLCVYKCACVCVCVREREKKDKVSLFADVMCEWILKIFCMNIECVWNKGSVFFSHAFLLKLLRPIYTPDFKARFRIKLAHFR